MPDTACISQKGLESIRAFVKAGGGLVALQESSLCDEFGTRRADFGLADLYGASFGALEDHTASWPNYPNPTYVTLQTHPMFDEQVIRENYRFEGTTLDYIGMTAKVKAAPDAQVVAKRGEEPFLILSTPGKGRSAYFAADIGQSYFVAPYPYERQLMANALRWAAGQNHPPVTVHAPMCVQAAFYEQENGSRTVVHLLNEINTSTNRALPEGNSSMREEIVPLSGIHITFLDPHIKRVRLEPEGQTLQIRRVHDGVEVTVPELRLHSMVVAER